MTEATYDVNTVDRDRSLVAPKVQGDYRRIMKAMVNAAQDADGFGVLLELEAELKALISERAAQLVDPELPREERYSLDELAYAAPVTKQAIHLRVQKGRASMAARGE